MIQMLDSSTIAFAKDYPVDVLLEKFGVKHNTTNFQCPFHSNGNERNYSGWVGDRENKYYCLACGANCDSIDIYRHFTGADFKEAVYDLANFHVLHEENVEETLREQGKIRVSEAKEPNTPRIIGKVDTLKTTVKYNEAIKDFTPYRDLKLEEKKIIDDFLSSRHLFNAVENLEKNKYNIGLIDFWGHKNIAFDFGTFIQVRYEDRKYNNGNLSTSYIKVTNDRFKAVFICEGITDALAVAELGYNAIVSHGVKNILKLNLKPRFAYILCVDDDGAGRKVAEKMKEKYGEEVSLKDKVWINFSIFKLLEKHKAKDINELLIMGKGGEL